MFCKGYVTTNVFKLNLMHEQGCRSNVTSFCPHIRMASSNLSSLMMLVLLTNLYINTVPLVGLILLPKSKFHYFGLSSISIFEFFEQKI